MNIDKHIINKLRQEYGDAFYLLDTEQFKCNFNELRDIFRSIYPNFNIAYSYKTNYTPKLCKLVDQMNGYAEVVSEMEIEIALRCGVKYNNIIWNGPIKNPKTLEEFLVAGGIVNIDSLEELAIIKGIVKRNHNNTINLGIRCNFEVGDSVLSRFGFDIDSEDFTESLSYIIDNQNIHLDNFQCHFAKRQIEYWPARAKGMIELINRYDIIPKRIDIGGGLFGKMADSLKAQLSGEIPDYKQYAEATATIIAEYFENKDVKPEFLIEPGSAIVGDCMKFVGTVKTIKNIRGKNIATVLGSQKNISMIGVNPPIEVIAMGGEQNDYKDLDFVGFTCIEGDVLYHNYNGKLANEDALVISNCGSYSLVMKPPFILPNFPVLDISGDTTEVIKRGEVFDDLFNTFAF